MLMEEALSIIAGNQPLVFYHDLQANVRYDHRYHAIRQLVQPNDPEVREVARVLMKTDDFVGAAQEFVNSFTSYVPEVGDYWRTPSESLADRRLDCDDMAILLCSILRNKLPAERVFCAFGLWTVNGTTSGHMFVVTGGPGEEDHILEATAGPLAPYKGRYVLHGIFNDKYVFCTDVGLKEFDLHVHDPRRR